MLNASDRKRLIALLGMLGSDQSGERDNAARLAEQFRRRHGVTWAEILGAVSTDENASRISGLEIEVQRLKRENSTKSAEIQQLNRDAAARERELQAWKRKAAAADKTHRPVPEIEEQAILRRLHALQQRR